MAALTIQQQQALALASARQRAAQAQTQQPAVAAPPAPVAAPAPAPQPTPAPAAPSQPPDWLGDIAAGLNALGDTASLGLAPAAMHAAQNFLSPGSGDENAAQIAQVNQQHPLGAAIGTVASIPVDMALAAPLAAVAPEAGVVNALVRGGGTAGNLGRMAFAGANEGAFNAATHGGDPVSGAAVGAALGPVAGLAAKPLTVALEKVITPAATRAWRYLANKLGENPDQLVGHVQQFVQQTGQQPSLQQIVSDHDAGVIAKFGQDNPAAGEILRQGAQASDNALPAQAQSVIADAQQGLPAAPSLVRGVNPATATHADILNARDQATDNAMNAIRPTPITLPQDLQDEIARSGIISSRQWRPMLRRMANDELTLDDADKIRQRLNKANSGGVFNPDLADTAEALDNEVRTQVPAYGNLMDQYAGASRYADSFAHGASGAERGAASDAGLRASLRTPEGDAGFRAGALSRANAQAGGSPSAAAGAMGDISRPGTAQAAFQSNVSAPAAARAQTAASALRTAGERARTTAPGSLRPQPDTSAAAANVVSGLAEAPIAPISAARNISRGLYQALSGTRLSQADQRAVAQGLVATDPAARTRAIRMLRIAGISDARIKLVQGLAAESAARGATNFQGAQ